MFYINSRKKYGTISESEALYVLQIPAGQRSAIQHQIVYCFFKENDTFKEI